MSFRVEQKIPLSLADGLNIIDELSQDGLNILYPERKISSDYFDTIDLCLFKDSEEGLLPRKKIRIRQYPNEISNPNISLETKISSVEGRFKTSQKISSIDIKSLYQVGHFDQFYGNLEPKINVSYSRKYFAYKNMRITLDKDIVYKDLISKSNTFCEPTCVIEIKAGPNISQDYLSKLFSLHSKRFSKYCNGIKFLNIKGN